MLSARNISFRYPEGNRLILDQFSIDLPLGARVGLLAPSGFGKTTLCQLLAGYLAPDAGTVLLNGQPLGAFAGPCPVQMVWQHPELVVNPRLRMRDVLAEAGPLGAHVLPALGIEPAWLERFPGELSGGELQRFCIARALGQHTRFLLADEISTMLDLVTQAQIWRFLLDELDRRGIGLLAVSHDAPLLAEVCTEIITL